ncbi:MAG: ATP-binding protein [Muribaculaceae bacterium]
MERIVGRKDEIRQLNEYYHSGRAEFIAVYGRRRIGKTFLVRSLYKDEMAFEMSGSIDSPSGTQISNFKYALKEFSHNNTEQIKSWGDAFYELKQLLKTKLGRGRIIVFIDELPCLDTPRSGFQEAFEHFWNSWASAQPEIMLIVCGSATSWIISNLIDSHGGLHNRITHEMHLAPFTLHETEEYLKERGFTWSRLQILQVYSALGGVPYYLDLLQRTQSVEQNIDRLFFSEHGELRREYDRLYVSLFRNSELYTKIIELLSKTRQGVTRKEIAEKISMSSGGTLTKALNELKNCDFIRSYYTRDKKIKKTELVYQLTDLYTLFYMNFCNKASTDPSYWSHINGKPAQNTWYGLSFERICMHHIPQIKKALHVDGIYTEFYSWRSKLSQHASQIDLIIERADNLVNLCEIKYSQSEYSMTKDEEMKIRNRVSDFISETGIRKGILTTFITTYGLRQNTHSGVAQVQVTMDELFEK